MQSNNKQMVQEASGCTFTFVNKIFTSVSTQFVCLNKSTCLKAKGQGKETNNLMLIKIYCRFEVLVHFHVSLKLWEICHAIPHVL
jgi:hypothetical protein